MKSDPAEFIYYIILLLFLSSFVFYSSKKELAKSLRYLGIWAIIFVIGIMLFSYKNVLVNSHFAANLKPSHGVSGTDSITYYVAEDNHFYITAELNTRPVTFLVDTGATDIVLSRTDAINMGLDLKSLTYNKTYYTANGPIQCASVRVQAFRIKDYVFEDVYVAVNPNDTDKSLLGIRFLQLFSKYEFTKNSLVLYR